MQLSFLVITKFCRPLQFSSLFWLCLTCTSGQQVCQLPHIWEDERVSAPYTMAVGTKHLKSSLLQSALHYISQGSDS